MDFATLGVKVESQSVKEGTADLNALTESAKRAEGAAKSLGNTTKPGSKGGGFVGPPLPKGFKTDLDGVSRSMGAAALSAKQYSQAMRLLPAQITDIVTGLASGQRPFLVAIQQGGQLRDSFGGIGAALRALGSIITPARLAFGGLAAAAVVVGKSVHDAEAETFNFEKAIALSGNSAGTTSGKLAQYAKDIDKVVGTQRNASDVLAQLTETGKVADAQLEKAAIAAIRLKNTAGVEVAETIKQFAALADAPTEASAKLNQQYNYLSVAQIRQIGQLEQIGERYKAAALAQNTFADAINERFKGLDAKLGKFQLAAKETGKFFAEMWDSIVGTERPDTFGEQLQKIEVRLAQTRAALENSGWLDNINGANAKRREIIAADEAERDRLFAEHAAAASAEETARRVREAAEREAADVRRTQDGKRQDAVTAEQSRKAQFQIALSAIQRDLQAELDAYSSQGDELGALHQASLITDKEYYDERKRLLQASTSAQVKALEEEKARLAAELASINRDAQAARKAADSFTGEDANEYARLQTDARQKEAQASQAQLQITAQIADKEAEIVATREKAISQGKVLDIEQNALSEAQKRYLQSARATAAFELETLQQQYDRALAAASQGKRQQEYNAGRNALEDRADEQRKRLQAALVGSPDNAPIRKQYEQELKTVEDTLAKELAAYDRYWEALTAGQRDWRVGASAALQDYNDEAMNVAKASSEAWTNGFRGMENSLLQLVTTGKINFKSLANSIISDLLRIQIRAQLSGVFNLLADSLGFGLSPVKVTAQRVGTRAAGGPVEANTPYLVGENGPELRTFRKPGWIVPNHELRGGVTVVQHNSFSAGVDQVALYPLLSQWGAATAKAARDGVQEDVFRRRGVFGGV